MAKIPKIIIQFAHNPDELPDLLLQAIDATKKSQCRYKHLLFDDASALAFIEQYYGSVWGEYFSANQIPASRCDIARLLILKELGGFYVDLSMELKRSLNSYRAGKLVLLQRDDLAVSKNKAPETGHYTNSIIGCCPQSSFIFSCIELMERRLSSGRYNKDVINATGPGILNRVLSTGLFDLGFNNIPFSWARENLFNYRRVKSFSNSWVQLQESGIYH